ncbi:MAG: hypothetical protein VYE22_29580 [Myxococcota bacterium]|nr:hypothetical protein [Myxococcota bacterium]
MTRSLSLGADAVLALIPHRRPFVFLDGVEGFARAPKPTLSGHKQISVNEPVFAGHFPGMSLWPGVYTVEGMGQTINALLVVLAIIEGFEARGLTEDDALAALRNIDARQRMGRRRLSELERELLEGLGPPAERVGLAGALDVKLIEPVYAGCTLRYRVTLDRALGSARRFAVEATVDGRPVARGAMTSALPLATPT